METIQQAVGDTMARPSSDQVVYVDLSEDDTVVVFDQKTESGFLNALHAAGQALGDLVEYFR